MKLSLKITLFCALLYCTSANFGHRLLRNGNQAKIEDAQDETDLLRLRRMKQALSIEQRALNYLQRYTHRVVGRHRQSSILSLEKELSAVTNSSESDRKWVNVQKVVRDCDADAFELTRHDPMGFCEIAKTDCASNGALNYLVLPFCLLPNYSWVAVLLMIFWLMVLVLWLSTTVDYICPNLVMVTYVLGIRDSVAGITFLAIGNGSSDIFSMVSAALSGPSGLEMAIGEVLGNGMFVFCVVQGLVALLSSFVVLRSEFLRDCGTYLLGLLLTFLCLLDGEVSLLEGGLFLVLYLAYITVVINFEAILRLLGAALPAEEEQTRKRDEAAAGPGESDALLPKPAGAAAAGKAGGSGPVVYCFDESAAPAHAQLAERALPVSAERWAAASWPERVLDLVKAPAVLMQNVTVPVVDRDVPNNNWNRPLAILQAFLWPAVTWALTVRAGPSEALERPAVQAVGFAFAAGLGAALALTVYFTSNSTLPPAYYPYLCFLGFVISMQWIYAVADEIVSLILAIGITCHFDKVLLGATLLAVGIGLQDLVTNLGITRAGHPNMAAAACIGSPLLNLLLGLGTASIVGNVAVASPYPFYRSLHISLYLAFLVASILVGASVMAAAGFRATGPYAAVLLSLYAAFVLAVVLLANFSDQISATAHHALFGQHWMV